MSLHVPDQCLGSLGRPARRKKHLDHSGGMLLSRLLTAGGAHMTRSGITSILIRDEGLRSRANSPRDSLPPETFSALECRLISRGPFAV